MNSSPKTHKKYKIFISYSSKDSGFVGKLEKRLTAAGMNCFMYQDRMKPGERILPRIIEEIKNSDQIIVIFSPNSVKSGWVLYEAERALLNDLEARQSKLRILSIGGLTPDEIPDEYHNLNISDCTTDVGYEHALRQILELVPPDLVAEQVEPIPLDRSTLPPIQQLPNRNNIPFQPLGDGFVGRTDDLWTIHDKLQGEGKTAIAGVGGRVVTYGLGGIGKTMAAVEYAYRFGRLFYPGAAIWISADGDEAEQLTKAMQALQASIPEGAKLDDLRFLINQRLACIPEPVLWIVDNLETAEWQRWTPTDPRIYLLVTTRRTNLKQLPMVMIDVLSEKDGMALLSGQRGLPEDPDELKACAGIHSRLGGLPLALEIAAQYLFESPTATYRKYLANLDKIGSVRHLTQSGRFSDVQLPTKHEKDIIRSFEVSYRCLTDAAKRLLTAASLFAPDDIPLDGLRRVLKDEASAESSSTPFDEALAVACRYCFIQVRQDRDSASIHRLIRDYLLSLKLDTQEFHTLSSEFIEIFSGLFENAINDALKLRDLGPAVSHAAEALTRAKEKQDWRKCESLATGLTSYYQKIGQSKIALPYAREAVESAETYIIEGGSESAVSRAFDTLGQICQDLGQAADARPLLERALAIDEQTWGPEHPNVASHLSNLATVLRDLGQAADAQPLLERALALAEQTWGPEHPTVAILLSNLARVLQDLGQAAAARPLLERARAIDEQTWGPEHPTVAISLSNLALVLQDLGQAAAARPLLERALAIDEQTWGPEHPTVAIRLSNLAMVLQALGQAAAARPLLERALAIDEQTWGPEHPTVAIRLSNLAMVLQALGQAAAARPLLERALAIDEQTWGPEHPSVAIRLSNLALVLQALGQAAAARPLLERALTIDEKTWGPEHPEVGIRLVNLGGIDYETGNHEEARKQFTRALEIFRKFYAEDHPQIANVKDLLLHCK